MGSLWNRLIAFVCETALLLGFYRAVPCKQSSQIRKLSGLACMLMMITLYLSANGAGSYAVRTSWRLLCLIGFLQLYHGIGWQLAAYLACLGTVSLIACQNIMFIPTQLTYLINRGEIPVTNDPIVNLLLSALVKYLMYGSILAVVSTGLQMKEIRKPGMAQWSIMLVLVSSLTFIKQVLSAGSHNTSNDLTMTLFPILLQLVLLGFMVYFERYLHAQQMKNAMEIQSEINEHRMKSVEIHRAGEEELRRLHHDMKNHLLSLRSISGPDRDARIDQYIDGMLNNLADYDLILDTGNDLLNGLISEKMLIARTSGIDMQVMLDFHGITFISDMDLCTLFGNLLDNALEACARVPQPDARFITLRSERNAAYFKLTISNTCAAKVDLSSGLPRTTKHDWRHHGLGLGNAHHVLEQYGGSMSIDNSREGRFVLHVLIPWNHTQTQEK